MLQYAHQQGVKVMGETCPTSSKDTQGERHYRCFPLGVNISNYGRDIKQSLFGPAERKKETSQF
jgi:hypothetical protein